MNDLPAARTLAGLTACACLSMLSGCLDQPATYTPRSGLWNYTEQSIDSNTCNDDNLPDPFGQFSLDYDDGDEFQIELGAVDAACEIDGTEFYCDKYELGREELPEFEVTFVVTVRWEGIFASDSAATGTETVTVSCFGDGCVDLENFPCSKEASFSVEFVI